MQALVNGLMIPLLFAARIWVQWALATLAIAVMAQGGAMIVGYDAKPVWRRWRDYGLLGPLRLALRLAGSKPKAKKKGGH